MEKWGYTWEAFDVTTKDGYILTTFHITGTVEGGPFKPDKSTVLIQHGALQDAASWIDQYQVGKPMPLMLADQGYDIWMGNNRGTEYSRGHTGDINSDYIQFWEFSYAEMGMYDDPANIDFIKEKTGKDKIFYLGYSQGTVQMFYSLIKQPLLSDSLHKFIALAPCTICKNNNPSPQYNLYRLQDIGVYSMYNDSTWNFNLGRICSELSQEYCDYVTNESNSGAQTVSVQDMWYWQFNTEQNRFQEYAPDYLTGGDKQTPLLDLASIKAPPITMFAALDDETCPYATANSTRTTLGDTVSKFYTIPNAGHQYFASANDHEFMTNLMNELTVTTSAIRGAAGAMAGLLLSAASLL